MFKGRGNAGPERKCQAALERSRVPVFSEDGGGAGRCGGGGGWRRMLLRSCPS